MAGEAYVSADDYYALKAALDEARDLLEDAEQDMPTHWKNSDWHKRCIALLGTVLAPAYGRIPPYV